MSCPAAVPTNCRPPHAAVSCRQITSKSYHASLVVERFRNKARKASETREPVVRRYLLGRFRLTRIRRASTFERERRDSQLTCTGFRRRYRRCQQRAQRRVPATAFYTWWGSFLLPLGTPGDPWDRPRRVWADGEGGQVRLLGNRLTFPDVISSEPIETPFCSRVHPSA